MMGSQSCQLTIQCLYLILNPSFLKSEPQKTNISERISSHNLALEQECDKKDTHNHLTTFTVTVLTPSIGFISG
jgi:hypothetical protein